MKKKKPEPLFHARRVGAGQKKEARKRASSRTGRRASAVWGKGKREDTKALVQLGRFPGDGNKGFLEPTTRDKKNGAGLPLEEGMCRKKVLRARLRPGGRGDA